MYRGILGGIVSLLLVLACGPAAPPAPAGGGGAPAGSGSALLSDAAYRQQVIEGARAEGMVNATLHTSWTPEGIQRLEEAIEREYGVRLRINFTPIGNYAQRAGELLSEVAANATPSFDLYQCSDTTAALMQQAGALEAVNWKPLLPEGTPPDVVAGNGEQVVIFTDYFGLMSDPAVVPESEVPRSIKDLANPRWRGRVILFVTGTSYLPWVIRMGREETFAALRAAVQNGAAVDTYPNQLTRFAAKEYPLSLTGFTFYNVAQVRGIPARFTPLDFISVSNHYVAVVRRAAHPNAAKLLAAVLAGPEGQRISAEVLGNGNRYYPDSREQKLEQEWLAAGFPLFSWREHPDALAWSLSPEGEATVREIDQILKGG